MPTKVSGYIPTPEEEEFFLATMREMSKRRIEATESGKPNAATSTNPNIREAWYQEQRQRDRELRQRRKEASERLHEYRGDHALLQAAARSAGARRSVDRGIKGTILDDTIRSGCYHADDDMRLISPMEMEHANGDSSPHHSSFDADNCEPDETEHSLDKLPDLNEEVVTQTEMIVESDLSSSQKLLVSSEYDNSRLDCGSEQDTTKLPQTNAVDEVHPTSSWPFIEKISAVPDMRLKEQIHLLEGIENALAALEHTHSLTTEEIHHEKLSELLIVDDEESGGLNSFPEAFESDNRSHCRLPGCASESQTADKQVTINIDVIEEAILHENEYVLDEVAMTSNEIEEAVHGTTNIENMEMEIMDDKATEAVHTCVGEKQEQPAVKKALLHEHEYGLDEVDTTGDVLEDDVHEMVIIENMEMEIMDDKAKEAVHTFPKEEQEQRPVLEHTPREVYQADEKESKDLSDEPFAMRNLPLVIHSMQCIATEPAEHWATNDDGLTSIDKRKGVGDVSTTSLAILNQSDSEGYAYDDLESISGEVNKSDQKVIHFALEGANDFIEKNFDSNVTETIPMKEMREDALYSDYSRLEVVNCVMDNIQSLPAENYDGTVNDPESVAPCVDSDKDMVMEKSCSFKEMLDHEEESTPGDAVNFHVTETHEDDLYEIVDVSVTEDYAMNDRVVTEKSAFPATNKTSPVRGAEQSLTDPADRIESQVEIEKEVLANMTAETFSDERLETAIPEPTSGETLSFRISNTATMDVLNLEGLDRIELARATAEQKLLSCIETAKSLIIHEKSKIVENPADAIDHENPQTLSRTQDSYEDDDDPELVAMLEAVYKDRRNEDDEHNQEGNLEVERRCVDTQEYLVVKDFLDLKTPQYLQGALAYQHYDDPANQEEKKETQQQPDTEPANIWYSVEYDYSTEDFVVANSKWCCFIPGA